MWSRCAPITIASSAAGPAPGRMPTTFGTTTSFEVNANAKSAVAPGSACVTGVIVASIFASTAASEASFSPSTVSGAAASRRSTAARVTWPKGTWIAPSPNAEGLTRSSFPFSVLTVPASLTISTAAAPRSAAALSFVRT